MDSAVESRYAQYNYSTDWAKNEAILLNIVRASEYQPLNFMSFQPYQGTASVSGTASSPSFIIGPARSSSQKQYTFGQGTLGGSATAGGTVTVTSLDTYDFYDSLLSPVDYVNLNAFQRQGYPRELLFRLFADYVSLRPGGTNPKIAESYIIYNDPSLQRSCFPPGDATALEETTGEHLPNQICFNDLVRFALLSGLSSEVRTLPTVSGQSNANAAVAAAVPAGKTPNSNQNSTPSKPQTEGRLCFDPALENRAIIEYQRDAPQYNWPPLPPGVLTAEYHPICGGTGPEDAWPTTTTNAKPPANGAKVKSTNASAPGAKRAPGVETLKVKVRVKTPTNWLVWQLHQSGQEFSIEIGTRSTFSLYSFLGRLLRQPQSLSNRLIGPPEDDKDQFILTVHKAQAVGCFTTAVLDLGVYCVPLDGAENTKRTFSILSQLLALKTTTDDLQLLPTIRLLPTN